MNNATEQLQNVQKYSVVNVSESNDIVENGKYIIEKSVPLDSTRCTQNNAPEKEHYETKNVYINANECNLENISNGKSEINEGSRIIQVISEDNVQNINNGKSEINEGLRIIQVISGDDVQNLYCIDNIKQEYAVTIPNELQEGSPSGHYFEQPLEYQDLNLMYTDNCIVHLCDVCGKGFRKKSNLKRHYRSHTGDNPHACDQCDARFPTLSRLKEHLHMHTGLRPHACGICGKAFSRVSNLTRHCRTHSAEKPYQCDKCEGRFVEPTRLREHYLIHVGEKRFSCDVCGKCFLKKFNLKRHLRTHTGDHPHVCGTCGRGFSKRIYLLVHMENHPKKDEHCRTHRFESEADSAIKIVASNCVVESAEDIVVSETCPEDGSTNDQENEIFSCTLCSRHYIKKSSLISHMKRHSDGRSLSCNVCDATFTQASRLREHLVSHTGEKPFACFQCKRRFGRNSNLLRHMTTHTGEKRFSCGLCKHRFSSNARLREHRILHSGEMPHSCDLCKKRFRHKGGLRRHLLLHTGERPHKCNACGKKFSRRGQLSHHCERHHATKLTSCGEPKFPNPVETKLINCEDPNHSPILLNRFEPKLTSSEELNKSAKLPNLVEPKLTSCEDPNHSPKFRNGVEPKLPDCEEPNQSPKFPNRVEPRLMTIIQNLEARLCEPVKSDSPLTHGRKRKRNKMGMEEGTKTKSLRNKNRKTRFETPSVPEEFEELTVEITTTDSNAVDSFPNTHGRSRRKCASKYAKNSNTRSCNTKVVPSFELKRKNTNFPKKKSRQNRSKVQHSKKKALTKQTFESDILKLDKLSKQGSYNNYSKYLNIHCDVEQISETSEQIEIDDVSAYQTQVLGSDLDTIVLVKATL